MPKRQRFALGLCNVPPCNRARYWRILRRLDSIRFDLTTSRSVRRFAFDKPCEGPTNVPTDRLKLVQNRPSEFLTTTAG